MYRAFSSISVKTGSGSFLGFSVLVSSSSVEPNAQTFWGGVVPLRSQPSLPCTEASSVQGVSFSSCKGWLLWRFEFVRSCLVNFSHVRRLHPYICRGRLPVTARFLARRCRVIGLSHPVGTPSLRSLHLCSALIRCLHGSACFESRSA